MIVGKIKDEILESLSSATQTRYSKKFIYEKEVRERFKRFYQASLLEIGDINNKTNFNIPAPWRIIFGHTHQPISWEDPNPPKLETVSSSSPKRLTLHNTGGWLVKKELDGKETFYGAEIFMYETKKGFYSISID